MRSSVRRRSFSSSRRSTRLALRVERQCRRSRSPGAGAELHRDLPSCRGPLPRDASRGVCPSGVGTKRQSSASRIASSEPGFSRLERSPGSSPIASARIARRTILALRVSGARRRTRRRAERTTCRGARPRSSGARAERVGPFDPGFTTTKHQIVSPFTSSGRRSPRTPRPPGATRARSPPRPGPAACPATLSVSSVRPWRNQNPSSSRLAQSPWTQMPGNRRQYVSR